MDGYLQGGESEDKDGNYLYKVLRFRHLNTAVKILTRVHNEYTRPLFKPLFDKWTV
jgi:hypothetical protein